MTSPLYETSTDRPSPRTYATAVQRPALEHSLARGVLVGAALLGVSADALMHEMHAGVAFGLWVALVSFEGIALIGRTDRSVSRETASWLGAAVLFALAIAWRNSETLQVFDILATFGCLAMAAMSSRDPQAALFARRFRDTFFTAIDVARDVAFGVLPLAFRAALHVGQGRRTVGRVRAFARPILIAAAALLKFGSLLRSADPIFASIVSLPAIDLSVIIEHIMLAGFFAWIVAGWARAALMDDATRHRSPAALPFQLGTADVTAALGTLIVLFAAFIIAQLGWFFGGEQFLRARTGLTAATYAREGFFQMVLVVLLVVPVLVGSRAALRPDPVLARRHTMLSLPVVGLLGAIIVSAMLRMKMYTHFYGLTTDRFYTLVFMCWLAVVVLWLSLTVLRNWGRPFIAGSLLSGLVTLLVLNVIEPDAIIARVNISRASATSTRALPGLDLAHLATLNGNAVELATRAVLENAAAAAVPGEPSGTLHIDEGRCTAARLLIKRWGPVSDRSLRRIETGAWRFWNRDDARALRVVSANHAALRDVEHRSCAAAPHPDH
jgi:hypothetical protein